uniref:Uncharacterized protein n=1 Tax=Anopheles funestus TaxID=62324 RepID=A0A4Y0BLJ2_ANOFN
MFYPKTKRMNFISATFPFCRKKNCKKNHNFHKKLSLIAASVRRHARKHTNSHRFEMERGIAKLCKQLKGVLYQVFFSKITIQSSYTTQCPLHTIHRKHTNKA